MNKTRSYEKVTPYTLHPTPYTLHPTFKKCNFLKSCFSLFVVLVTLVAPISLLSQNCIYQTIPEETHCYIQDSYFTLRDLESSPCVSIPFDPVNMIIENASFTIDGTFAIDQSVTFRNCVLSFTPGSKIRLEDPWYCDNLFPCSLNDRTILTFETNCVLKGCDGNKWEGIEGDYLGSNVMTLGPDIVVKNSIIKDAENAISMYFGNKQGTLDLYETTFQYNTNCLNITGNKIRNCDIENCIFENSQNGIIVSDLNRDIGANNSNGQTKKFYSFWLTESNKFNTLLYAIKTDNIQGIRVENQIMNNVGYGLYSDNMRGNLTQRETFRLLNNTIESDHAFELRNTNIDGALEAIINISGNTLTDIHGNGILINGLDNGHLTINDNTFNDYQNAVYLLNLKLNDFNLDDNHFYENYHGVRLLRAKNLLDERGSMTGNVFYPSTVTEQRVSLRSPEMIRVEDNTFNVDGHLPNSQYNILDITDGSFIDLRENTFNVSSIYSKSTIHLANSMGTEFCCNTLIGGNSGLHIFGTNRDTKIKNTTFKNNDMRLEQSMIRIQVDEDGTQFGNRWQGTSNMGELISSNIAQAPFDNQFRINLTENDPILGDVMPQTVMPALISSDWFDNNTNSNSLICENQINCGFTRFRSDIDPESWISPPDSIPNLGTCYPLDLDSDGDGICNDVDPDPDDACVPTMLDQDGDGICDPLDPDPQDGCNPIYRDTDRDGICDTTDPDPWDPCLPNFVDSDNDGICDRMDPDPNIPGVYNIPVEGPSSLVSLDRNGDALNALGYNTAAMGLNLSIGDLEEIANMTLTNVDYEELNYIESQSYLYRILLSSPYYRLLSPILENAYITLSSEDVGAFEQFNLLSKSVYKPSNSDQDDLLIKDLYLNRLSNVAAHLDYENGDSVLIEDIEAVIDQKTNELYAAFNLINADVTQKKTNQYSEVAGLPNNHDALVELKNFYEIDLGYALSPNPTGITQSQQNALWQIWNKCPLVYGKSVYLAQDLLVSEGLFTYEDFTMTCAGPAIRSREDTNLTSASISVYPNPTNGQLYIDTNIPLHKLTIYSMTGQLLTEMGNITDNIVLDLSEYKHQGFVTLRAIDNKGSQSTHKVILIND